MLVRARSFAGRLAAGVCWSTFALFAAPAASALPWAEVGDAGDLTATAQVPVGNGVLDLITGLLGTSLDKDMYVIEIVDPAGFSARVVLPGSLTDSQLFLFDPAGSGVYGNDDDGDPLSTLPAGDVDSPQVVGTYFLTISGPDNDPTAGGLEIFTDNVAGTQTPLIAAPVDGWTPGFSAFGGTYRIELTGAQFAVPEPSTSLLLGLGLAGLAALRRST